MGPVSIIDAGDMAMEGTEPDVGEQARAETRRAWDGAAIFRFVWTLGTTFAVESLILGLSALPAVSFFQWHASWNIEPSAVRTVVLVMALAPAYVIFAVLLMVLSSGAMRLLGWRPVAPAELPIATLPWALCNWARYQMSAHVVGFLAGGLLRATPVWSFYMRLNGARLGHRVWVNSLGVTDHCLLDFGNDVVIGAGVHLSGHTVERGIVILAPVRIGAGSTIGVNAHIEIGADIGPGCQIGSLSMVPKHSVLPGPGTYAGVPARLLTTQRTAPVDD
jgi:acetyltransferase-like isoleucine patch superfamily enzyme